MTDITTRPTCIIGGCGKPRYRIKAGLCVAHRARQYRHGNPLAGRTGRGVASRGFLQLVLKRTDECVEWPFSHTNDGYGLIRYKGKMERVHRLALSLVRSAPADQPCALHLCDNRKCLNVRHLEWGTNAENMAQMVERVRQCRGRAHYKTTLSEQDILAIRQSKRTQCELAKQYGITQPAVSAIRLRKTWKFI